MNRLGGTLTLALGVARRQTVRTFKAPYLLAPMLVFPLLLFAAFAGGLSAISRTPNFNYFNFTTFQLIYVLMVGAALGGVQTGLTVADDFESGFARRMLISTPQRGGLVLGYVLAGLVRFALVALVLTAVAVASGARMHGDVIQVAGLYGVAGLFNVASTLYATGFAFRARSTSAGVRAAGAPERLAAPCRRRQPGDTVARVRPRSRRGRSGQRRHRLQPPVRACRAERRVCPGRAAQRRAGGRAGQ